MSSSFEVRVVDSVEGGVVSSWMISVVERVRVVVSVTVSVVERAWVVVSGIASVVEASVVESVARSVVLSVCYSDRPNL